MMLALASVMVSCEKEHSRRGGGSSSGDNFDYGNATGKHLVQETAVNTSGDRVEVRYRWNGNRLVHMSIMDSMEVSLNYTDEKLSSMRCVFVGYTMDYSLQYSNGRLSSVSTTMAGMDQSYEYEWSGDNVSAIRSTMTMMGYPVTNTTYLSWSNGNLVRKWDDYGTSVSFQYDNHPTPYTLDFPKEIFLVFLTPEYTSANNTTRVDTAGRVSRVINWTYTPDGYPASNGRSDVGFNYYLYADGDGSTGPANSGGNGGGTGGGGGITPTPTPDINTSLVGTSWSLTENRFVNIISFNTTEGNLVYYEYNNDGTLTLLDSFPFTYSYANGSGTITLNNAVSSFVVNGNTLTFEGLEGVVFYRMQ